MSKPVKGSPEIDREVVLITRKFQECLNAKTLRNLDTDTLFLIQEVSLDMMRASHKYSKARMKQSTAGSRSAIIRKKKAL
jgi:hypothetical protein